MKKLIKFSVMLPALYNAISLIIASFGAQSTAITIFLCITSLSILFVLYNAMRRILG